MIARVRGSVVPVAVRRALVVLVALCAVACWLPAASLAQLSWSTPAAIDKNGHGQQSLSGVACPSATQCTAVDQSGQQVTFNPASPGTPTPTAIDVHNLDGVACPTATQCTAVDVSGRQVTFNPASPGTPTPTTIDTDQRPDRGGVPVRHPVHRRRRHRAAGHVQPGQPGHPDPHHDRHQPTAWTRWRARPPPSAPPSTTPGSRSRSIRPARAPRPRPRSTPATS